MPFNVILNLFRLYLKNNTIKLINDIFNNKLVIFGSLIIFYLFYYIFYDFLYIQINIYDNVKNYILICIFIFSILLLQRSYIRNYSYRYNGFDFIIKYLLYDLKSIKYIIFLFDFILINTVFISVWYFLYKIFLIYDLNSFVLGIFFIFLGYFFNIFDFSNKFKKNKILNYCINFNKVSFLFFWRLSLIPINLYFYLLLVYIIFILFLLYIPNYNIFLYLYFYLIGFFNAFLLQYFIKNNLKFIYFEKYIGLDQNNFLKSYLAIGLFLNILVFFLGISVMLYNHNLKLYEFIKILIIYNIPSSIAVYTILQINPNKTGLNLIVLFLISAFISTAVIFNIIFGVFILPILKYLEKSQENQFYRIKYGD